MVNEDSNSSSSSTISSSSSSSSSSKKSKQSFFQLCRAQLHTNEAKPHADLSKTLVYLKIFWQTENLPTTSSQGNTSASHTKCVGSSDKIVGLMISHLGSVYNMLVATEICPGISNPLHFPGSQFGYINANKRAELIMKYNADNADDLITFVPRTLELRYGAFVGHTCSTDERKMEELQLRYAKLVDILQENVHGLEDTENESSGPRKRISIVRDNIYLTTEGEEEDLQNILLHMKVFAAWIPLQL